MGSNPTLSAIIGMHGRATCCKARGSIEAPLKARLIRHADIPPFGRRFDADAYDLRAIAGSDLGIATSVMHATVAPGRGPIRHRHPHTEIFVIHTGAGQFEVDGEAFDAEAGDVLIIPPGAWHGFIATGSEALRETAIHESPRISTEWEDGTRHD